MNWREVLAMPPAMKRVVPVTAALRAKRLRGESDGEAMVGYRYGCAVGLQRGRGVGVIIVDKTQHKKSGVT
jgi:hypothetical protein